MDQESETQLAEDTNRAEVCTPCRIGSYLSSLPTVVVEKACDAFVERIHVAEPDDFERHGLVGRIFSTRSLRSLANLLAVGVAPHVKHAGWGAPRLLCQFLMFREILGTKRTERGAPRLLRTG
eukprot:3234114-Amphidinium_carterae.2